MLRRLVDGLYASPPLLLILTTLGWAGNTVAGQLAVGEVSPFMLVLLRWLGVSAVLCFVFFEDIKAAWPVIRPRFWSLVAMATIGFTTFNGLFYVGSQYTSGVNVGILQGAMPAAVLIGAFLTYRTPVSRQQIIGVGITMVGVVIIATKGDLDVLLQLALNRGDVLMLIAVVCYALYAVMLKGRPSMPGGAFFALLSLFALIGAAPLAAAEAWMAGGVQLPSATGWLVTLYVTIFPSCLSQLFFLRAVDLIGPGRAGVYVNLVPVFAAILNVLLLGQIFEAYHAAALALVLIGILLAQRG